MSNGARAAFQIAVATLTASATDHEGAWSMIAPIAKLASADAMLDRDGWESSTDLVNHLALIVYARKFRQPALIRILVALLATVHVLNVTRVLQVGTHVHALMMMGMSILGTVL